MVLDTTLFNTQHYKEWIKGKVKQSREWSNTLPLQLGVVAIVKGAFKSPSMMVANITHFFIDQYYTGWNDKIVVLEKKTWFHFHLMKTSFLFLLQTIY